MNRISYLYVCFYRNFIQFGFIPYNLIIKERVLWHIGNNFLKFYDQFYSAFPYHLRNQVENKCKKREYY